MRVALLTNFIPPYRLPLYGALAAEVGELRILLSTRMESNRAWTPEWRGLDVVVQRTLTLRQRWRTPEFTESNDLHIPYDTMAQLRRWRPDAIVTAEMGARSLQAVAYARARRTPVVLWATLSQELETGRGAVRALARRWLLRRADAVIVNGESGARYVRAFGVTERRILRVPYTADVAAFASLPIERPGHAERRLLFVGTLSSRKGIDLLMTAVVVWAERNPDRRILLTVVGDGPLRDALRSRATPENLRVLWSGNVEVEDLPRHFGAADLFLFPTLGDEWGVVVNESLAAGVPVVGSQRSQAVQELVTEGRNGWRFSPSGPEEVAEALDRALSVSGERLAQMRRAARATGIELRPEVMAARIANRLRELCGT